jgi:general stress protein CsbA
MEFKELTEIKDKKGFFHRVWVIGIIAVLVAAGWFILVTKLSS